MPEYLSLDVFKMHNSLEVGDLYPAGFDGLCNGYLDAAEAYIGDVESGILRRPVISTEFTEKFADFASVSIAHPDEVTEFTLTTDGTVVADIYTLEDGAVALNEGEEWPDVVDGVTATYRAGWAAADVPAPISSAGYFVAATLFQQRSGGESHPEKLRSYLALALSGYRRAGL